LFRAINDTPAESFRDAVGTRLDLAAMLRLVAADVLLGEADGIVSFAGHEQLLPVSSQHDSTPSVPAVG
jgi:hypothetical protein